MRRLQQCTEDVADTLQVSGSTKRQEAATRTSWRPPEIIG